jgi:hypothetical protein
MLNPNLIITISTIQEFLLKFIEIYGHGQKGYFDYDHLENPRIPWSCARKTQSNTASKPTRPTRQTDGGTHTPCCLLWCILEVSADRSPPEH